MRQISSQATFFNKRVFPVIWFGFLAVFFVSALIGMLVQGKLMLPFLLVPPIMALGGYFVMREFVWCLLDEVFDAGECLITRNGGLEDRIAFSNIVNLSYSQHSNPKRITLTLREPSRFGREVSFSPRLRFSLNPFQRDPLVTELIDRIDAARGARV